LSKHDVCAPCRRPLYAFFSSSYFSLDVTKHGTVVILAPGQNNVTSVGDSVLDEILGFHREIIESSGSSGMLRSVGQTVT